MSAEEVAVDLLLVREGCDAICSCMHQCYEPISSLIAKILIALGVDEEVYFDENAITSQCISSCMRLFVDLARYLSQRTGRSSMFTSTDQAKKIVEVCGNGEEESI